MDETNKSFSLLPRHASEDYRQWEVISSCAGKRPDREYDIAAYRR